MTVASKKPSPLVKDIKYADEKGRLYFYDNAKFILIFLVVLAHAISPFRSAGPGYQFFHFLWRVINTLHMPCLIFISGFFAKSYIGKDGSIKVQRLFTYVMYYVASQLAVGAFEIFVLHDRISMSMLYPRSSLWFLVCLIWWYLLLPVIDKIDPKYMLPIAFAVGILIGYDEKIGNFLSFSRMIVHFPFFLSGYYISSGKMQQLATKKAKLWSVPVLLLSVGSVVGIMFLFSENGPCRFSINEIITCNVNYFSIFEDKGINPVFWFLPRVWFYLCAFGLGFSFLAWVPKRKNIFTKFGARTMAPYIIHRFLYLAYLDFGIYSFFWFSEEWFGWKDILVLRRGMMVFAFLLTVLLSLYPFYWPFEMLGKIKIAKLLKKSKNQS
ncbi:MAG: acyltransferase family protein [Oscillospiraceae bacterium]|nr:acyltransferase family protein [Oscillospiraceae bacterium]